MLDKSGLSRWNWRQNSLLTVDRKSETVKYNSEFYALRHFSPTGKVTVKSLASDSQQWPGKIGSVRLVGGGKLKFTRDANGLHVSLPEKFNGKIAFALKVRS